MSELDKAIEKMKELKEAYEYTIRMGIGRTKENDEYCKAITTLVSTIEQLRDKVNKDNEDIWNDFIKTKRIRTREMNIGEISNGLENSGKLAYISEILEIIGG